MADEGAKKADWAIVFLGRLCLIAWICAILYEAFDFLPFVRKACLFFGPWACVLALLHGTTLLVMRKRGIFLVLVLLTLPPTFHFGLILKNIVAEKKLFEPDSTSTRDQSNPLSEQPAADSARVDSQSAR